MRKMTATILSLCALCAFALPKAADFFTPFSASAESANEASARAVKTELLSPSSYEQYLSLSAPSDVAVTDDYTAIADGSSIHVYDRESDTYLHYEHTKKVTKLQFSNANLLYFLDADTNLHTLDPDRLDKGATQATSLNFVCTTFAIFGSNLYYSHTSGLQSRISKAPLNNLSASTTIVEGLSLSPALAYYNNELYYTDSGKYLNKINPETKGGETFVAAFPTAILSMTISDNVLTCVTDENNFFAYNLLTLAQSKQASAVTPITKATGGYTSLALHGNYVYAIQRKTVKQYSLKETAFTDYEISSASSAANRLSGATDVYLSDDRLFLSDVGNKRVSVFNTETKDFEPSISSKLSAEYIVSDGDTLLISGDSGAELYDLNQDNYGVKLADKNNFAGNVVGVAGVYGAYYLVTDRNFFYALTADDNGAYSWSSVQKSSTRYPSLLTADAYGNLYVVCETSVYLYTEDNFTATAPSNVLLTDKLPENTEKISVDYGENLYALKDNALYKFTAPSSGTTYTASGSISLKESLVYGDNANVASFAFSIEDNWTYVLYGGNYLVRTNKLDLPTVKNIPVNGADEHIFNDPAKFSVVLTKPNALVVEYDFDKLENASVFPYLSFDRREEPFTALKIGESGAYDLLVTFDEKTNGYHTYLVYGSSCQEVVRTQYESLYEAPSTGYLTGDAPLYKYPFLSKQLINSDLARGTELSVLGEIKMLEREYYYVSYQTENGETVTGYLPKVYVTPTSGEVNVSDLTYGETSSKTDAYGRLIYLLLGGAAICVLTDFLILRKLRNKANHKDE